MTHAPANIEGDVIDRMVKLLSHLAPNEGDTLSFLPTVRFIRASHSTLRSPTLYNPSLVIVCQGSKRGYLGDKPFVYHKQQYLLVTVPMPFECETLASPAEPFLAIVIRIDLAVIAELALLIDQTEAKTVGDPQGVYTSRVDERLEQATLRLLEALESPLDSRILGASLLREVSYRVLTGAQGGEIRAALLNEHHLRNIAKSIQIIHENLAADFNVEMLARQIGMSQTSFHVQFKAVTSTSPLQYIKTARLHEARRMMMRDGLSASLASIRVGYSSPSQFSREFKRLFGRTPVEEMKWIRSIGG